MTDEEHAQNQAELRRETEAYLKKIHKTIQDSKNLIQQTELRMAETDRLLEGTGLTREQLAKMEFSAEQLAAVNAELKRRGLPELEAVEPSIPAGGTPPAPDPAERDGSAANRHRKFGVMMQQFRV